MKDELRKYRRRALVAALILAVEVGGLVAAYHMNSRALVLGHELGTQILQRGLKPDL